MAGSRASLPGDPSVMSNRTGTPDRGVGNLAWGQVTRIGRSSMIRFRVSIGWPTRRDNITRWRAKGLWMDGLEWLGVVPH